MAKITEIGAWLHSNKNYQEGVQLFEKYGTGGFLLSVLKSGCDEYNSEKLEAELLKLEEQFQQKEILTTGVYTGSDYVDLPATIKEMIAQVKQIYKENGARHALLSHQTTDFDRGVLANTILDEDHKARHLLRGIDHYKEFKTIPTMTADQISETYTEAELIRRIANLRSRISKLKRKNLPTINLDAEMLHLNQILDELV